MKKTFRMIAMLLAVVSLFCAIPLTASADLRTGADMFGRKSGVDDSAALQEIYDDLCYRIYEFDEDVAIPELKHMLPLDEIGFKRIQSRKGFAAGQDIFEAPKGEARWSAKDGCMVKVYATYGDWTLVELMINEKRSEGTIGWVPSSCLRDSFDMSVSAQRSNAYVSD